MILLTSGGFLWIASGINKGFQPHCIFQQQNFSHIERWINALNVLQIWAVVSFAVPSDKAGYSPQQRTLFYANQINC